MKIWNKQIFEEKRFLLKGEICGFYREFIVNDCMSDPTILKNRRGQMMTNKTKYDSHLVLRTEHFGHLKLWFSGYSIV